MNVELVAQMFKNYQSNVLFHLEGINFHFARGEAAIADSASNRWAEGALLAASTNSGGYSTNDQKPR